MYTGLLLLLPTICSAFELVKVFKASFFGQFAGGGGGGGGDKQIVASRKATAELLDAISGTQNGKTASLDTQTQVLRLVDYLETKMPPPGDGFKAAALVDGLWFLQYTQPSDIGIEVEDLEPWTVETSSMTEAMSVIDNRSRSNAGQVNFLGLTSVETANKTTTQSIDVATSRITNRVEQDFGTIQVAGSYEVDTTVTPKFRVIVSFDTCQVTLKNGFVLDLSLLFDLRAFFKKGSKVGGWLETTYVNDALRIGRGNRGSLFVLTREQNAVAP